MVEVCPTQIRGKSLQFARVGCPARKEHSSPVFVRSNLPCQAQSQVIPLNWLRFCQYERDPNLGSFLPMAAAHRAPWRGTPGPGSAAAARVYRHLRMQPGPDPMAKATPELGSFLPIGILLAICRSPRSQLPQLASFFTSQGHPPGLEGAPLDCLAATKGEEHGARSRERFLHFFAVL